MNFRRMFNDRKHHKRSKRGANKVRYMHLNLNLNDVNFATFLFDRMALNKIMYHSTISNKMEQRNNSRTVRVRMKQNYAKN